MLDRLRPFVQTRLKYLLVLLPLVWILHPLLAHRFFLSEDGDSLLVHYPLYHIFSVSMNGGMVPMWNQLLSGGLPLMATGDVGVVHPLNLILFHYMEPYAAWRWATVLAALMNVGIMHVYLRARGLGALPTLLGAVSFGLGGFFVGHLGDMVALQAMSMLPLALLLLERYRRTHRLVDAALIGAPLALTVLAGSVRIGLMTLLALLIQVFWELVEAVQAQRVEARKSLPGRESAFALESSSGPGSVDGATTEGMRKAGSGLGGRAEPSTTEVLRASRLLLREQALGNPEEPAIERRGERWFRLLGVVPVAVLVAALLAAPQLMLTWDYFPTTAQANGLINPASPRQDWMSPAQLLQLLDPLLNGNPFKGSWLLPVRMGDSLLYIGIVGTLLSLMTPFGLWLGDRRLRFPLSLTLVGIGLALGPTTPLWRLFGELLPFGNLLGGSGIWVLLAQFGLASLAAHGLEILTSQLEAHPHPAGQRFLVVLPWLCLGVTAVDLGYHGSELTRWIDESVVFEDLESDSAIPAIGYYRIFSLPGVPEHATETAAGGQIALATASTASTAPNPPTASTSRPAIPSGGLVEKGAETAFKDRRALLWRNTHLIYRKPSMAAAVSLQPRWQYWLEKELLRHIPPNPTGVLTADDQAIQLLHFLGVRVLLSYFQVEHPSLVSIKDVPVAGVANPVHLYGLTDGAPRAYLARNVRACTQEETLSRILSGNFGPGRDPCVLDEAIRAIPGGMEKVKADENGAIPSGTLIDASVTDQGRRVVGLMEQAGRGETFLEVSVELLQPAFLVLRDGYAPGWIGEVDGVETPLFPVDLMYRAVKVPQGKHKVRMEYRPRGLREGLLLNTLGLMVIALLYGLGRSNPLNPDAHVYNR